MRDFKVLQDVGTLTAAGHLSNEACRRVPRSENCGFNRIGTATTPTLRNLPRVAESENCGFRRIDTPMGRGSPRSAEE